jgi:2-dehydrotetronate isomerase
MPRFAANLTMMFNEVPFLDRFGMAAKAGFTAVEYLFPYEQSPEAIRDALATHGLTQALFNMPPGDWAAGERGLASLPERAGEFRAGVETALTYAKATGCRRLHMMAGLSDPTDPTHRAAYRDAAAYAADQLGAEGIDLLLEPINGRDMPGFFLNDFRLAEDIIADLGRPNVRLQFDIYHRQIIHGDVTMALRQALPLIGHVQIASIPSRNEPDGEEMNYPFLFAELDRLGYDGFVGCEYRPRAGTLAGLGWFAPWRAA